MEKISFKKDLKGVLYFNADINFWYNLNWRNAKIVEMCSQIQQNAWLINFYDSKKPYVEGLIYEINCDSDFLKACNIEIVEPFYILFDENFKVDVIEYKIRKFEEFKAKVFLWCKSSFAVDFVVRESFFKEMQEIGVSLKKEISEKLVAIDEFSQRISKINPTTDYSIDAIELGALTFFDWINNLTSIDDIYRQLPTKEEVKGIENLFFDDFYLADEKIDKHYVDAIRQNLKTEKLWEFLNKNLSGRTWNYETPLQVLKTTTPPATEQRGFDLGKETELKSTNHFKKALDEFNIEEIRKNIETHFSELPYDDKPKGVKQKNDKWEGYFRSNLFSYLKGFDIKSKPEEHTQIGRSDLIVERENKIYCFEVKYNGNAQDALEQIIKTDYLKKYGLEGKQLIAIGLNFSASSHNIEDLKYQILNQK